MRVILPFGIPASVHELFLAQKAIPGAWAESGPAALKAAAFFQPGGRP